MASKKLFRIVICGILLFGMAIVLQHSKSVVDVPPLSKGLSFRPSEKPSDHDLQVLDPAQFGNQSDFKCINAAVGKLIFPICVYEPQNDNFISKTLMAGRYYESDLVQKMLNFFRIHRDVSFVDLGANLGIYSLPVAHSGIHVVSVEPNKDTVRRLAKSVHLGRIEHNVDLFHYALSNEEATTFLKFDASNRGNTFMADNGSCPGCLSAKVTVLNKLTPFIRHKKAFIKIDTQEAEIKIFQERSAGKFFEEIDVVMIQMEWDFYPKRFGNTEDGRKRVDRFLDFFYERRYEVYDPKKDKKLGDNWTNWPYDVLFKKEDLPKK